MTSSIAIKLLSRRHILQ